MKMKIVSLISVIIITNIIFFNTNIIYADDGSISDIFSGADDFIESKKEIEDQFTDEEKENEKERTEQLRTTSNLIYQILLILGISIAVIVAGVLGIKFMMGSVEEKAQIKDALIPFIVGCIVIFGAVSIWKIVVDIGNNL